MQIEELLGVIQDCDGAPLSFSYQGKNFLTSSRPIRWYSRKLWWDEIDAAPKGSGGAILETEMWRLWASCDLERKLFELIHKLPEDTWVVQEVS